MTGDELDIEALLEAPFVDVRERRASPSGDHPKHATSNTTKDTADSDKSSRRYNNHSSRSPTRSRNSHSPRRDYDDASRRRRSRSPTHRRSRSPAHRHHQHHQHQPHPILTEAQRDRRTVFCRQLAQRLEARELKEFCETAGKVRDVKIVYDKISRRSKGVAYVEFVDEEAVPIAVKLTGKKLLGIPIIIELTETEKNRLAEEAAQALKLEKMNQSMAGDKGTMILVDNLHPSIMEADLRRLFQPMGEIASIKVTRDDVSKASAQLLFAESRDAQVAMDKLDAFMLMGRPMRLRLPDHNVTVNGGSGGAMVDELLAESLLKSSRETSTLKASASPNRPSPALLLQHMYDPAAETSPDWAAEIAEEVGEECRKYGPIEHLHVAKSSDGDVFVRFSSTDSARAAQASLNGRWFGGRQIIASFIPLDIYLQSYPRS